MIAAMNDMSSHQATLRLRPEQPVGVGDDPDLKVIGGGGQYPEASGNRNQRI